MKFLGLILTWFLFVLASSTPTNRKNEEVVISENKFPDSLVVYTSEHDIVSIVAPLHHLNFDDDESFNLEPVSKPVKKSSKRILFFVLADIKNNGQKDYKGIYYMNDTITALVLENGTEATTHFGNNKNAYFAARDGIYYYNEDKMEVEKYGTVSDNLKGIAVENGSDTLYVLNVNHELYKVTENGSKKTKLSDDVEEFVLDLENNVYYYGKDKLLYVLTNDGSKIIEGLPVKKSFIKLLRPVFFIQNGIAVIVNNKPYVVYSNGTVKEKNIKFEVRPTAFALDAAIIQYFGYNKKIYEYNLMDNPIIPNIYD